MSRRQAVAEAEVQVSALHVEIAATHAAWVCIAGGVAKEEFLLGTEAFCVAAIEDRLKCDPEVTVAFHRRAEGLETEAHSAHLLLLGAYRVLHDLFF